MKKRKKMIFQIITKKKTNQNEEEKPNRVIPQHVYDQIDKKDLMLRIINLINLLKYVLNIKCQN